MRTTRRRPLSDLVAAALGPWTGPVYGPPAAPASGGSGFQWGTSGRFFPDLTNTGYAPTGVTLTTTSGFTASTGTTYDSLRINGDVIINTTNVTIKRCLVNGRIKGPIGTIPASATGLLVQDTDINGGAVDGATSGPTNIWTGGGALFERCSIYGCENGVHSDANGGTFRDCYFHDLIRELGAEPQPHTDGIQTGADVSFLTVDHCHFYMPKPSTSAINIDNESGATANNITINNTMFRNDHTGMGFIAYFPRFPGWSNIAFTNNICQKTDKNAYFDSPQNTTTWSGNVDYDTGATLTN